MCRRHYGFIDGPGPGPRSRPDTARTARITPHFGNARHATRARPTALSLTHTSLARDSIHAPPAAAFASSAPITSGVGRMRCLVAAFSKG